MPLYRIADLTVSLTPRYPRLLHFCRDYLAADQFAVSDLCILPDDEDFVEERRISRRNASRDEFLEIPLTYRKLCTALLSHGAFFLHAAVIEKDGVAFAFSAPSGTGKSTHVKLWREKYGDSVTVINGDKPIVRKKDGRFHAYGTPWCGKEGWNKNSSAPIGAICFLERGEENRIERLSPSEALRLLFSQLLIPKEPDKVATLLSLTDSLLSEVPAFRLHCTISTDAAMLAYTTMKGAIKE